MKRLNDRLYELGYLTQRQGKDFTAKTQTAVNAFAARAGLRADNRATPELQTVLYSASAPYAYDLLMRSTIRRRCGE